ncbi:MAG: Secreted protease metal-dependent protease [Candidatus Ozemobacter sibiricus]|uniref:Secreted protease metal-dependent protease n=1 Tax=Candidatus Ozemobacter sibiricus TaxID=2268124 RepID=A0A367ZJ21_9BACT|nr:MAG: Secreted protease metal-dependent protease [Candidatus Ozemobacter sibiricus]
MTSRIHFFLLLGLLIGLLLPLPANAEWVDATHLFEEEVRWLADNAPKETEEEYLTRTRGIFQSIDRRPPQVGDEVVFNTFNVATMERFKVPAILRKIGKHCYAYVEKGRDLAPSTIEKVVNAFDARIYPNNTAIFGSEWNPGIDGDPRITLFFLDIRDGYGQNGNKNFTAGYFYAGDEYPTRVNPHSNQREMLYLDISPADPSSDQLLSVLAHEFQHMIHWHHDPKEHTWLNEACSQLAVFLNGFDHPNQVFAFIRNSDNNLIAWANETAIANYGQVYLFAYFLANRVCANVQERNALMRAIVAHKSQGITSIADVFKRQKKPYAFSQVFDGFCVANFINDPTLANGFYGYDKFLSKLKVAPARRFTGAPFSAHSTVKPWSAKGYQFDLSGSSGPIRVAFAGQKLNAGPLLANIFDVAVVLSDSRRRVPTQIEWLKLANHKADAVLRLQAGRHDTMHLIVCHRGPIASKIEQTFAQRAPPAEFSFTVTVSRGRSPQAVVAARPARRRVDARTARSMMEDIAGQGPLTDDMTRILGEAGVMTSSMEGAPDKPTMEQIVAAEEELFEAIRDGIETGDLELAREFFAFYDQASEEGKRNLASLRARIEHLIRFECAQNRRAELEALLKR